ncbi:B3/B4 domain-containing protein [Isobaculum melis]|uniref:B3/B4 domain-containing protein (DNA/RNA-binding domain of Phe-tRNA-synthetase) n=1 Tax=Isobaculum melis TaxID=142588 RepID=A0A1H9SDW3_9LACT|nr:phenylalanine--tRNA ligase beta subunit-related protein [Isobaculum melis]SER82553.1 B3/B4 domain-containing protein (DNA/RNA-binding domain of Phe-tRNA-synthetase) [Isobaculum melis]
MKQIMIDSAFWELFPEAQISVLVIKGLDNHVEESKDSYFEKLLKDGKQEAKKFLTEETFSQNQVIEEWRQAFSQFKTKKGARSSIEALLKRVSQDRDFYPINPLVDIYNSISMKYALPCGGENIEVLSGDLHLGKAKGGESFFPLGAEADAPALAEEIIYYDNDGAVCRSLNWREAQRTMLTEETKNAVLVIEAINPEQAKRASEAINELKQLVDSYFKVESVPATLTSEHPVCPLSV